ncbi:histone acetyltransferase HPA2 [Pseudomonas stutzeri]|nr:histone acetyltransferase HPA2 [Stutzerimonas stutzeri]
MSNAPERDNDQGDELPAIEFRSPGRFAVHNPASEACEPAAALEPAPFVLGQHPGVLRSDGQTELRSHALALTQQARRTLRLFTPDLEPWLYDQRSIAEACGRLLRAHPRNRLHILLRDSALAVRNGHALLRLARALPSNCQIRRLPPDYPGEELAYLLVDDCGLLLRTNLQQPAAQVHYQARARVRQLQRQFDQAWESAVSDAELRSFLL